MAAHTMQTIKKKDYWEVDIGLSESASKIDLGCPSTGHFNVTKVKAERIVKTVAPKSRAPMNKKVQHCPISKSAS